MPRTLFLAALALAGVSAAVAVAQAQSPYPTRPLRLVVPTAAAGGGDTAARILAQGLVERLGQQVIVENRPGAGGILGYEQVARAAPDGYTLLFCAATLAINPAAYRKLAYDAQRDFTPVTQAVYSPHLLVAHPSLPVKSVKALIAFAKARPGDVLYASGGHGTAPHLAMELFALMTQVRMTHVPYKGISPAVVDLIAGQVTVMAPAMISVLAQVKSGKLAALGVTSARRSASAPEIPTVTESGVPGYETVAWFGLLAPAGTPAEIIARLQRETATILHAPENRERIAGAGAEVQTGTPAEFAAFIRTETAKWARVAKAAGMTPE